MKMTNETRVGMCEDSTVDAERLYMRHIAKKAWKKLGCLRIDSERQQAAAPLRPSRGGTRVAIFGGFFFAMRVRKIQPLLGWFRELVGNSVTRRNHVGSPIMTPPSSSLLYPIAGVTSERASE